MFSPLYVKDHLISLYSLGKLRKLETLGIGKDKETFNIDFNKHNIDTASLAQLVKHVGTEGISDSQNSVQVQIPCSPSYRSNKKCSAILYNE